VGKSKSKIQLAPYGILTKREIIELNLITMADYRCYKHASYDLRLGAEYFLPASHGQQNRCTIQNCAKTQILRVPPFSSVIVETYESVKLPANVAGRFDLRINHALTGLMVQMGTQIEPGYEGKLFALLHNVSDREILLKYRHYDTRLFTVEFHYTSEETIVPPDKKKNPRLIDFVSDDSVRGSLEYFRDEMEKLHSEAKELSTKKLLWLTGGAFFIIALLISVGGPWWVSKMLYDKDYYPLVTAEAISQLRYENTSDSLKWNLLRSKLRILQAQRDSITSQGADYSEKAAAIDRQITDILVEMALQGGRK